MLSREEARAIYALGEERVIDELIAQSEQLDEWLTQVKAVQGQIDRLVRRVTELEARLNTDSHNSDKPPSSDGLRKPPPRSQREPSGKPSGGQAGHRGTTLEMVAQPDRIEQHAAQRCAGCGQDLGMAHSRGEVHERRQVFDVPEPKLEVVEHQTMACACPTCGQINVGAFPVGVDQPVQYGSGVKALGVYASVQHVLPLERTCEFLEAVTGQRPSEGTLVNALAACAEALEPVSAQIKAAVKASPVSHHDETGVRIANALNWLHVSSTETLTHYAVDAKRGSQAHHTIGILPTYRGIAVHDGYASYFQHDCEHALCNAHIVRELTAVHEQTGQAWAAELKTLLVDAQREVAAAKHAGHAALSAERQTAITRRYDAVLNEAHLANPPPERVPGQRGRLKQSEAGKLATRMTDHADAVLRFTRDFRVPFDNNQAERDLRMMKVKQKVSGCFRSPQGATQFCRIRGYLSTIRKQGGNALVALRAVFEGRPILPQTG